MFFTTPNKDASAIYGGDRNELDTPKQGSDRVLLICVIILMVGGILAVYSAIAGFAAENNTTAISMVGEHMIKLAIAFSVLLIASKIDYHNVVKYSRIVLLISWGALIFTMIFGDTVYGAQRSLELGFISFQPATLASVALLIHVSVLLSQKQEYIKSLKKAFSPIMVWVVITFVLIAPEDFSGALVLLLMCLLVMFIGRISILHLGSLILACLVFSAIILAISPERQRRISEYFSQISNIETQEFQLGGSYQAQQAEIAIARGGIFGVGMGESTQRYYLPAAYNDFIFAIIAEEYGLVGSLILIAIFIVILYRGFVTIANNAPDALGMLLAVVCCLMIVIYGLINAGVACGLLPVTGLPMPFVSFGGTNMVFSGLVIGILLNISKHNTNKRAVFYA